MKKKFQRLRTSQLLYSRELTYKYNLFNHQYFDGQLPNLEVYYDPMKKTAKDVFRYGYTAFRKTGTPGYIAINRVLKNIGSDISHLTLLHEMVHVKFGSGGNDEKEHKSVYFCGEIRRLVLAGAFDGLI